VKIYRFLEQKFSLDKQEIMNISFYSVKNKKS